MQVLPGSTYFSPKQTALLRPLREMRFASRENSGGPVLTGVMQRLKSRCERGVFFPVSPDAVPVQDLVNGLQEQLPTARITALQQYDWGHRFLREVRATVEMGGQPYQLHYHTVPNGNPMYTDHFYKLRLPQGGTLELGRIVGYDVSLVQPDQAPVTTHHRGLGRRLHRLFSTLLRQVHGFRNR